MAERLTFEGNFCDIARCRENRWGKHCPDGACSQRKVWERLKQYEDSDAVPVVRCKDCVHWEFTEVWFGEKIGTCVMTNMIEDRSGFCSHGERRTNDRD